MKIKELESLWDIHITTSN